MYVVGLDEAGRGALAGPVFAAAVVLDSSVNISGLNDSKKITAKRRESLFLEICEKATDFSVASASAEEIDQINILQASLLAMKRAFSALKIVPAKALVDGNKAPDLSCEVQTIIGGDALEPSIMAASILAKVSRDRYMLELCSHFPEYEFGLHKGYPTARHRVLLTSYGACSHHRRSFAPVAKVTGPKFLS